MATTETKETKKVPEFVKLSDLTAPIVSKLEKYPVKFTKVYRNGREMASIYLNLHNKFLRQLNLRAGGPKDFISNELFNLIILEVGLELEDKKGRDLTEWNRNVPVRFVTGSYSNMEGEYKSIEIIFKKGLYITHFLSYDQQRLLENLEEKKLLKIKWEHRPDTISKEVDSEDIEF